MDELKLVEKFKKLSQDKSVLLGPGDDSAVIKSGDKYILFCGDMLIEDVHFNLKNTSFKDLGFKAVARTLSDIASMGGVPKYIGVSLALPKRYSNKVLDIFKGIKEIAKKFKLNIVGGDLSRARNIFLDVWCLGFVEKDKLTKRQGAVDNDGIFVSGRLGGGYKRKFKFTPKIKEARFLVKNFKIHSMIDMSDGLVLDLYRILLESKKEAVLFEENIPLNRETALYNALYDGEDYQLLFTTSLKYKERLKKKGFYFIGKIKEAKKPRILIKDRCGKIKPLKIKGYLSI